MKKLRDRNVMIYDTLAYYNQNATAFFDGTILADIVQTQYRFLDKLKPGAHILDFGCGSGCDTKCFLDAGFLVDAIDGSSELCRIASQYIGIPVKQMLFQKLDSVKVYDGILGVFVHPAFAENGIARRYVLNERCAETVRNYLYIFQIRIL